MTVELEGINNDKIVDDVQCYGGSDTPLWNTTNWDKFKIKEEKRMIVELWHNILGYRAINSLLSYNEVGDDLVMVSHRYSLCDSC